MGDCLRLRLRGRGSLCSSALPSERFSGPYDLLYLFFFSEGNIASEDSSLSDALVLEDGMLVAVFSRGPEGKRDGCVNS